MLFFLYTKSKFGKSSHISQNLKHHSLYNHSPDLSNPKRWMQGTQVPCGSRFQLSQGQKYRERYNYAKSAKIVKFHGGS
jgi:hypothetical protein